MTETIYTIGHSTHPIDYFIGLLHQHGVTAVGDVRSRPYSRMNPQFNREYLKESLSQANIKYVFLGKELGARSEDKRCYHNGRIQYDRLAQTDLFRRGLQRVIDGSSKSRIALMCAEKEPLDCHRTILVSRWLAERGTRIKHILSSGDVEDHIKTIERLVSRLGIPSADMFRAEDAVIADAYTQRGIEIAYREEAIQTNLDPLQHNHHSTKAME